MPGSASTATPRAEWSSSAQTAMSTSSSTPRMTRRGTTWSARAHPQGGRRNGNGDDDRRHPQPGAVRRWRTGEPRRVKPMAITFAGNSLYLLEDKAIIRQIDSRPGTSPKWRAPARSTTPATAAHSRTMCADEIWADRATGVPTTTFYPELNGNKCKANIRKFTPGGNISLSPDKATRAIQPTTRLRRPPPSERSRTSHSTRPDSVASTTHRARQRRKGIRRFTGLGVPDPWTNWRT